MTVNKNNRLHKGWSQWDLDTVWHLSGYSLLGISAILALRGGQLGDSLPLFLALSALLALWYFPFTVTPIFRWLDAPRWSLLYFLVGFTLWGGLVTLNGASLMLVAMFNPMIFTRFPFRWAVGIMILLTVTFFPLYLLLYSPENWLFIGLIVLGLLGIAISIGYFFYNGVGFFTAKR